MFMIQMSSLITILSIFILPCAMVGFFQYIICKHKMKYGIVLPILSLLYFIIMIILGYPIIYRLSIEMFGIILGIVIVLAF